MALDLRKHGLHFAVASIASQGKREGCETLDQMIAYVLDAFHGLTALEIRDMLATVISAQVDAAGSTEAFARILAERVRA